MELRDYQRECLDVINTIQPGSYLVVLPVGAGKTVIFSHIKRKGRVLIISHRDELVHQPEKYYDCSFGTEIGGESSNGEEVVSASIQTLIRRLDKFQPDDFDMIITDEAHHAVAPSYQKVYAYFKPRLHIGFTATPNRADKVGLAKVYSSIIYHKDMKWAIRQGYLCDIRCFQVDIGYDVSKVKRRMGDFDQKDLDLAVNQKVMNQGIAHAYQLYAKGQTIIFAMNVSHAENIRREICEITGNPGEAEVISGATKNRDKILDRFRDKTLRCIVNCMVLTEGTDLPMIETVIMARPTPNSSLYCQAVGRGTRLYPGKQYLNVVDCMGASGKVNLCSAPCLFGLDLSVVPSRRREKLNGVMLTDTEKEIIKLTDNPEAWIINAQKVDLFAEDLALDLHGVNWQLLPDGTLLCNAMKGEAMQITPMDELGKCRVCFLGRKSAEVEPQEALDLAYEILVKACMSESYLWDSEKSARWGDQMASKKQKDYIRFLIGKEENRERFGEMDYDFDQITKAQANLVINRLLCKNA